MELWYYFVNLSKLYNYCENEFPHLKKSIIYGIFVVKTKEDSSPQMYIVASY
jgi:hypothetical protein